MTEPERNIPRSIGGYQILEILGEGGMSVVYTAMQDHPRRKVAIKVLRGGVFSPTASRRFHLEVEILGKLDHPWIAKVYEAGTHDDGNGAMPFFVMEHVSGARELTTYLNEEALERREVLKLFAMISSAIEHGHHRGVVHRDLKPGNILIDENGEPKIIDFGVARSIENNTVGEEAMTEAGRLVGTVQFMAPEQVDPKVQDIDARCDVYALGVVLYQMLTLRLPRTLEGLPIYEAVRQICEEEPVRPTIHDKTIDANIEAIILKAIRNDREQRYQTAGAMGRDVLRYLGHKPIKARKVGVFDRLKLFLYRHDRAIIISTIASVVAISFIALFIYKQEVGESEIERLEAEISELRTTEEPSERSPTPSIDPEPLEPVFTLPTNARNAVISTSGSVIAAVAGEDFYLWRTDGSLIQVPPMNIDPAISILAISQDGQTLGVVADSKCRIAQIHTNTQSQSRVSARFTRSSTNIMAAAVDETRIAITSDDMTIELFETQKKTRRTTSTSGQYLCIELPSPNHIVAATPNSVFVWSTEAFPNNSKKYEGVQNPVAVGLNHEIPAVIGRTGELVYYVEDEPVRLALDLPGEIAIASFNTLATEIAFVIETSLFHYDIGEGELEKRHTFTEEIEGVSIDNEGGAVCWLTGGAVFEFTY
jgi:serine/threonine protein kinase